MCVRAKLAVIYQSREALNLLLVSALKVRTCEELTRPRETVEEFR